MRDDDALLRRYLLGELNEEEENRLEARLIQDGDLFEQAEAMEADLLEEHAHGGLSTAQRARIRRHLSSSPATRTQLAMVRGLGTVAQEERPSRRILTGPWGQVDLSLPQVRALAAAAMLAIAVLSVGIARIFVPLPQESPQLEARQDEQDKQVVQPTPPAPTNEEPVIIAETPEPTPEPPPVPPAVLSQVFKLALATVRSGSAGPEQLRIEPGTKRIDFQIDLAPPDEVFSSFQVVIRDDDGKEVIQRTDLRPGRAGEGAALLLPVEEELLPDGWYEMTVVGVKDTGEAEEIAFPQLEVSRS